VPSVRPLPLAGGTVSAVGSDAGASAITALTLNPSVFLTSARDPREAAAWSRFGDLTVFFPVDGLDQDNDGKVDYFGARARLNIAGPAAGSRVLRAAGRAFAALVQEETDLADRITRALLEGPDPDGCIAALDTETLDGAAVLEACGNALELTLDPREMRRLQQALGGAGRGGRRLPTSVSMWATRRWAPWPARRARGSLADWRWAGGSSGLSRKRPRSGSAPGWASGTSRWMIRRFRRASAPASPWTAARGSRWCGRTSSSP
jgi:hypothetical protein